jgi:hypothetical protein
LATSTLSKLQNYSSPNKVTNTTLLLWREKTKTIFIIKH